MKGYFLTLIFFLIEEETKVICFDQGLLMEGSRLESGPCPSKPMADIVICRAFL